MRPDQFLRLFGFPAWPWIPAMHPGIPADKAEDRDDAHQHVPLKRTKPMRVRYKRGGRLPPRKVVRE